MTAGPDGYRARVESALADGWRFAGLHAADRGGAVRVLLIDGNGEARIEATRSDGGECPTLVDLVPAAGWDER